MNRIDILLLKLRKKPVPVFLFKRWILLKFFLHHENLDFRKEERRRGRCHKIG